MTTTQSRLPKNYTKTRPIRAISRHALDEILPSELAWIAREWYNFESTNPDDEPFNVILELTTPQSQVRIWCVDRNSPEYDEGVIVIRPEDY